jgi:hypothetical protein
MPSCSHALCSTRVTVTSDACGACADHCELDTCVSAAHKLVRLLRSQLPPALAVGGVEGDAAAPPSIVAPVVGSSGAAASGSSIPSGAFSCAKCRATIDRSADSCGSCAVHCEVSACASSNHALVRQLRSHASAGCSRSRADVANDFDGRCPCGRDLTAHAKAARPRDFSLDSADTGPDPPPRSEPADGFSKGPLGRAETPEQRLLRLMRAWQLLWSDGGRDAEHGHAFLQSVPFGDFAAVWFASVRVTSSGPPSLNTTFGPTSSYETLSRLTGFPAPLTRSCGSPV